MTDVIIGVVLLMVASIVIKVGKNIGKTPNSGHGENFPFPKTTFDEMSEEEEEEDWLGRVKDEVVIAEDSKVSANSLQQAALAREMAKVVQRPAGKVELGARRKEEAEFEVFDFDAQKAIIYSEIIRPKFMEY